MVGRAGVARLVGVLAVAAGTGLLLAPFHHTTELQADPALFVTSDCGLPVAAAVDDEAEAGWFAYAPDTAVSFSAAGAGRFGCRPEARWRTGIGAAIAVAGLAAIVVPIVRRRRRGADATGPVDA